MIHEISAGIIIFLLILLNGFFSMSEMAVISSRKQRLKAKADEGHASYGAVVALTESPTAFLSTIQIGITLIGILAGAYGEETIAVRLRSYYNTVPFLAEYSNAVSTGTVVVSITFVSILFGELIPKRIALGSPERIASLIVYPMKVLSIIFMPLVRIFYPDHEYGAQSLRKSGTGEGRSARYRRGVESSHQGGRGIRTHQEAAG